MFHRLQSFGAIALLALNAASVQAAPVVYFGENQLPGERAVGAPATARASFLASLPTVGTETFEGQTEGDAAPLAIAFPGSSGSITATISGERSMIEGMINEHSSG